MADEEHGVLIDRPIRGENIVEQSAEITDVVDPGAAEIAARRVGIPELAASTIHGSIGRDYERLIHARQRRRSEVRVLQDSCRAPSVQHHDQRVLLALGGCGWSREARRTITPEVEREVWLGAFGSTRSDQRE
jgi:hypothetical protein